MHPNVITSSSIVPTTSFHTSSENGGRFRNYHRGGRGSGRTNRGGHGPRLRSSNPSQAHHTSTPVFTSRASIPSPSCGLCQILNMMPTTVHS